MPPLWQTIEIPPGRSASISSSAVENVDGAGVVCVDHADAIRTAERELPRATQRDQRLLQLRAFAAGIREAARVGDAMANTEVRAFCNRLEQSMRGNREDRELRHVRQVGDARKAPNPATAAAVRLTGHTRPG